MSDCPGDSREGEMISCEEAFDRVYDYLDGELSPDWTEKVRYHVEICRKCWPHFNFERAFLDPVRNVGHEPERNARLEQRIRDALDSEQT